MKVKALSIYKNHVRHDYISPETPNFFLWHPQPIMPANDAPAVIVARFLKANHYNEVCLTSVLQGYHL